MHCYNFLQSLPHVFEGIVAGRVELLHDSNLVFMASLPPPSPLQSRDRAHFHVACVPAWVGRPVHVG